MRTLKNYIFIFFKGLAMGSADVVPGVSGGTIAFITGIYEELLNSINSFNLSLFKTLKSEGIKGVWKKVNGNFLLALFAGIGISILSLSKVIKYLLEHHPILLWSFFFGLIIASIIYLFKEVEKIDWKSILGLLIGAIVVILISNIPAQKDATNSLYIFMCGMIAICAMILPGISGSFILVILGAYSTVFIDALANFNVSTLAIFGAGAIIGLLLFSRFLSWILKNYKNVTFSVLIGFLIGSLYKVWPWKHVEKIFIKHEGESNEKIINLVEKNVLPKDYDLYINKGSEIISYKLADPQLGKAVIFCVLGFALIFAIEAINKSLNKK